MSQEATKETSSTWETALTVVQEVQPPFIPEGAQVMTVVIQRAVDLLHRGKLLTGECGAAPHPGRGRSARFRRAAGVTDCPKAHAR